MARYRTIKPELFSDGSLSECSRDARLLFVGLLPFVDDMGRRRFSAKQLKNEVFPGDTDIDWQRVLVWFRELVKCGVVEEYEIGNAKYFRIPHFLRHQKIDHPSHTDSPPSPRENGAPACLCDKCKSYKKRRMFLQEPTEDSRAFTEFDEDSRELANPRSEVSRERGKEVGRERESKNTQAPNSVSDHNSLTAESATSEKDRRAEKGALDEIAMRLLELLQIQPNALINQQLIRSIKRKAKAKECSFESAAQQIGARAAFVSAESPPEDWSAWFADAGYSYVPQGDRRLQGRQWLARPICGGALCNEGWEPVKVNGIAVLRRCPQCAQLWRDGGYSSD
jgi:hypothetical protein